MPYRPAVLRRSVLPTVFLILLYAAGPARASGVWKPLGPDGGTVTMLLAGRGEQVFAVTKQGTLFVSDDGAVSWRLGGVLPVATLFKRVVAADPLRADRLYAAAGYGELWRSDDAGASWNRLQETPAEITASLVELLAVEQGGQTVLLRLLQSWDDGLPRPAVSRSTDGGVTWRTSAAGLPAAEPKDLAAAAGGQPLLFVAGAAGVHRSTDGGATFHPLTTGLPAAPMMAVATTSGDPSRVYALDEAGRAWVSRDRGGRWSAAGALPPNLFPPDVLTVHRADPDRLYALRDYHLLTSGDGGHTWSVAEPGGGAEPFFRVFAVLPPQELGRPLLTALGQAGSPRSPVATGGVWASHDEGAGWQPSSRGLHGVSAPALAVAAGEPPAVYAGLGDRLWTLPRDGTGWRPLGTQPPALQVPSFLANSVTVLTADPRFPERLVLGRAQGVDDTWSAPAAPGQAMVWTSRNIGCIVAREVHLAPSRTTLGYVAADYLYRECGKEDVCALYRFEWDRVECIRGVPSPNAYTHLTVDPRRPHRLWALAGELRGLWTSEDGGDTWLQLPATPFSSLDDLVADPLTPDRLHAAADEGGVWRSDDGGVSWARRGPPAGPGTQTHLLVDPVEPRRLTVLAGGAVFASDDGGVTWTPLAAGLPAGARVFPIALDPADPLTLYAGVAGAGVWRLDRRLPPAPCVPDSHTLCLGDGGRFRVRVVWRDFQGVGRTGRGRAAPLTSDTGAFWFFRAANRELVVKVLDGRPVNGRHWVFYASLTNVPFTMLVTDTATGETQGYHNPERLFASRGDTAAFPEGVPHVFPGPSQPATPVERDVVAAIPCESGPTVLCLGGGRFRVEAEWETRTGATGPGRARPDTTGGDSGIFWFFRPDNLELAVKVLDGGPVNGHHWVFYGSLTNVAFRLHVTDTATGRRVTYVNPQGRMASRGDTAAFRLP